MLPTLQLMGKDLPRTRMHARAHTQRSYHHLCPSSLINLLSFPHLCSQGSPPLNSVHSSAHSIIHPLPRAPFIPALSRACRTHGLMPAPGWAVGLGVGTSAGRVRPPPPQGKSPSDRGPDGFPDAPGMRGPRCSDPGPSEAEALFAPS